MSEWDEIMGKELIISRPVIYKECPPFPHNMLIELTNCCNHKCVFCHYQNMNRKKTSCDKDFMFDVMKQAFNNGTREIGFYMIGEPLLKSDIGEYIAYAHNLGFEYIYLTTNGALASLDKMKTLINAGLNSIKFSINAATPEHYKIIHGADDYLKVKDNIHQLHDYITKSNINLNVFISFVKTLITENDITLLHNDFDSFVDKIYVFECSTQGTPLKHLIDNGFVEKIETAPFPCEMVFNRIHVTCEGFLNPCCSDTDGLLNAVDLHKISLLDAWNSDIMRNLRKQFLSNKLDKNILCYNCLNNTYNKVKPLNPELYNKVQLK